jgi:hypothetical protein
VSTTCGACGVLLSPDSVRQHPKIVARRYCAPEGSPCHDLGERNARWVLTPDELADLWDQL